MGRRIRYRPGKASGMMSAVGGGIFVLIGLFVVIPTFGLFGVLWTAIACCITVFGVYSAFGKNYVGPEIHIEGEEPPFSGGEPPEARLETLQGLYDRRLITQEEYEAKRAEIIREL